MTFCGGTTRRAGDRPTTGYYRRDAGPSTASAGYLPESPGSPRSSANSVSGRQHGRSIQRSLRQTSDAAYLDEQVLIPVDVRNMICTADTETATPNQKTPFGEGDNGPEMDCEPRTLLDRRQILD